MDSELGLVLAAPARQASVSATLGGIWKHGRLVYGEIPYDIVGWTNTFFFSESLKRHHWDLMRGLLSPTIWIWSTSRPLIFGCSWPLFKACKACPNKLGTPPMNSIALKLVALRYSRFLDKPIFNTCEKPLWAEQPTDMDLETSNDLGMGQIWGCCQKDPQTWKIPHSDGKAQTSTGHHGRNVGYAITTRHCQQERCWFSWFIISSN